ncbi:MAG: S8 family serine peptidase, partial [Bryobacteraceae bacterium]
SWGVSGTPKDGSCIWCKTAERAAALGTVIVKSAGNSGSSPGSITCPAAAKGDVIVVGNAMRSGTGVMERSSRGPTADGRIKPDILAPGEKISAPKDSSGGDYVKLTGTSMAAPHISGLAALMLEQNKLLKPWQIKKALMDAAKKLDGLDGNAQGSGLANIGKAMEAIKGTSGSVSENQISMTTPTSRPRQVDTFSIGFRNTGKSNAVRESNFEVSQGSCCQNHQRRGQRRQALTRHGRVARL